MNEALYKSAEFIGLEKAKTAGRYAAAAGLEVMKYDPVTDTWYLTDGEAYSSPVFFSWFCTVPN